MNKHFAKRMNEIRASEIREILKLTAQPGIISFAGGLPAPELFPLEEMKEASTAVLNKEGRKALQYSTTEGDPNLRQAIAKRMNDKRGTGLDIDSVLITSGSQQGLDMCGKLLLDEGDVVLCESPTYIGAISAFKIFGPRFVEVPTDDDGLIIDELEERIRNNDKVKMIYVIPDFQNPSGRCWSLERRRQFMELVNKYDIPVVEDSPYAELRFAGTDEPSLKSLDTKNLVIFLGTFSKTFCPGLRVAWIAADPDVIRKLVLIKQGTDLHTSTLAQMQINEWLEAFDLDAQVEKIREVYKERQKVMIESMDRLFPTDQVSYTRPDGGLFLWMTLPATHCARELLKRCLEVKVAFVPGGSFFPVGDHENTLRLNFSAMPPEQIRIGVERMAEVLKTYLAEPGKAGQ
ncbi:MAG: PLP-dependent aminotransferase family protein [bacterium]|nr:PLP-dependent aminotransferase family protein [bacterium]